jgi:hypothetical protein
MSEGTGKEYEQISHLLPGDGRERCQNSKKKVIE